MQGFFLNNEDLEIIRGLAWPNAESSQPYEYRSGTPDATTRLPPLVDLTGYTAVLKIRASLADDAPALASLTESSGIALGDVDGTIAIALTNTQTSALPIGTLFYDLVLFTDGGSPVPFMRGQVIVSQWIGRT